MFSCPHCGRTNQVAAAFCIHCGEPIDAESLADFTASHGGRVPSPQTADRKRAGADVTDTVAGANAFNQGRRLEAALGLGVLVAVLAFVAFTYVKQQSDAGHYRAGLDAGQNADYGRALAEFTAAGDYLDSRRRAVAARDDISKIESLYRQAKRFADQGRWFDSASVIISSKALQKDNRDLTALLAKARSVNGKIVNRDEATGALSLLEADGASSVQIPGTTSLSNLLALSADGKWLVYVTEEQDSVGAKLFLYNIAEGGAKEIYKSDRDASLLSAQFSPDSSTLWVDDSRTVLPFALLFSTNPPAPTRTETAEQFARARFKTLHLTEDAQQSTTSLSLRVDGTTDEQQIATEHGRVDGALFSEDGRYLLYRVCAPAGSQGGLDCSLRVYDSVAPGKEVISLAGVPLRKQDDTRNDLRGEFTLDSRFVLVLVKYNDFLQGYLYSLQDGTWINLPGSVIPREEDSQEMPEVVEGFSSALGEWHGPNSLAYTDSNETIGAIVGLGDKVPYFRIRRHWLASTPDGRFVVVRTNSGTEGAGDYNIFAQGLTTTGSTKLLQPRRELVNTTSKPVYWPICCHFLADGHTIVMIDAPNKDALQGIYGYSLDTGNAKLLVSASPAHTPWPEFYLNPGKR